MLQSTSEPLISLDTHPNQVTGVMIISTGQMWRLRPKKGSDLPKVTQVCWAWASCLPFLGPDHRPQRPCLMSTAPRVQASQLHKARGQVSRLQTEGGRQQFGGAHTQPEHDPCLSGRRTSSAPLISLALGRRSQ